VKDVPLFTLAQCFGLKSPKYEIFAYVLPAGDFSVSLNVKAVADNATAERPLHI